MQHFKKLTNNIEHFNLCSIRSLKSQFNIYLREIILHCDLDRHTCISAIKSCFTPEDHCKFT